MDAEQHSPLSGQHVAIAAEVLYLVNLMLAPGLAFLGLCLLKWMFDRDSSPPLARSHVRQTFWVSLLGGSAIVLISASVIHFLGIDSGWTWTIVVIYFTCVHSTLILLGVVGLTKALACKPWRYPVIGPR
jgi:hypothetical protein